MQDGAVERYFIGDVEKEGKGSLWKGKDVNE